MNFIGWPKMFKGSSTVVTNDNTSVLNSIHLLFSSELGELFGDPGFGLRLKRYTFEQNNYILKDILIDEIYSQLTTFCPYIILDRKNITLSIEGSKIYVKIVCKNKADFVTNTYDLVLLDNADKE